MQMLQLNCKTHPRSARALLLSGQTHNASSPTFCIKQHDTIKSTNRNKFRSVQFKNKTVSHRMFPLSGLFGSDKARTPSFVPPLFHFYFIFFSFSIRHRMSSTHTHTHTHTPASFLISSRSRKKKSFLIRSFVRRTQWQRCVGSRHCLT